MFEFLAKIKLGPSTGWTQLRLPAVTDIVFEWTDLTALERRLRMSGLGIPGFYFSVEDGSVSFH